MTLRMEKIRDIPPPLKSGGFPAHIVNNILKRYARLNESLRTGKLAHKA
ncbi:MAG: hypothetical protein M1122_02725 [Candidatus Marsarchaeota archaeon]|nr:hypothetical protein [Candidatus Marsarchaeota archaeon]